MLILHASWTRSSLSDRTLQFTPTSYLRACPYHLSRRNHHTSVENHTAQIAPPPPRAILPPTCGAQIAPPPLATATSSSIPCHHKRRPTPHRQTLIVAATSSSLPCRHKAATLSSQAPPLFLRREGLSQALLGKAPSRRRRSRTPSLIHTIFIRLLPQKNFRLQLTRISFSKTTKLPRIWGACLGLHWID